MTRSVTAHGRSGRTVTASASRTATTVSVSGGGSGKTVHGRPRRISIAGIGASILILASGSHASSSPPVVDPVSGAGAATLSMSGAGQGAFVQAVTGTAAGTIDALAGTAAGDVLAPVTGTGAGTLGIFSNTGIGSGNYPTGTADATLVLDAAGVGQHIAPIVGAGASTLAITGVGAGRADQLVAGAATGLFALTAAASGTASGGASDPVPASVSSPVVGTDLTAVWNLQFSGTGPRTAASNGTWPGHIDAYLTGKSVAPGNDGALFIDAGTTTINIANYAFTAAPQLHLYGSTSSPCAVNFTDCIVPADGVTLPTDINGGINLTTGILASTFSYCDLNLSTFYQGTGDLSWKHCRFRNQVQGLGDSGLPSTTGVANLLYEDCYITGGGCNPPHLSHVELTLMQRPNGFFTVRRCLINVSVDGQTLTPAWGSGWTAFFNVGNLPVEFIDCIMIGAPAVNANPANPNVIGALISYGTGANVTITNCVMEPGFFGYTHNGSGTANRPIDGGGNRSFANVALTAADFG